MSATGATIPLLMFEAADCLMALPASEIGDPVQLSEKAGAESSIRPHFDLGDYFVGEPSDGPLLRWARGTQTTWLRVRRVIDVVPIALSELTPMPMLLRGQRHTRAFLAAGVRDSDVFLLLDPARLPDSSRVPS